MLTFSKEKQKVDSKKGLLRSDMKDLGLAGKILGMRICRDKEKDTIFLS